MPDSHIRGVKRVRQGHRFRALIISAALTAGVMALPGGTAASALAALAASASPSAVPAPPPSFNLTWSNEFTGAAPLDVDGQSSFISHAAPQYLLIAVGW